MAIVVGGIRVQAVFQGVSGLPEDRYVNTWHFADTGGGPTVDADFDAAIAKLEEFYMVNNPITGSKVWNLLAGANFDQTGSQWRCYNLEQDIPRTPYIVSMATFPADAASAALPSEVAMCLSYRGLVSTPSTRGRLFIGPLNASVVTTGSAPAIVDVNARNTLVQAAERLRTSAGGPIWSILGGNGAGGQQMVTIAGGWVDDAFDTQRRRGEVATTRTTWGV